MPVESSSTGLSVLIVDDEPAFGSAFGRFMKGLGCTVRAVPTADEALKLFKQYDVVVIDLDLGTTVSGFDVAREILKAQHQKWIFLVSAHEAWLKSAATADLPTQGEYAKPIRTEDERRISSQVNELSARKQRRDEAVRQVVGSLRDAADSANTDELHAQISLGRAKDVVEEVLLPVSRVRRGRSLVSIRREITLMLWAALARLSFVPSEQFRLVRPDREALNVIADCFELLMLPGLDPEHERRVDEVLRSAGLAMAPLSRPTERPDLTLENVLEQGMVEEEGPR